MKLSESALIITGGASGLGQAVAQMALKEGAHALIIDIPSPEAETSVSNLGSGAKFLPADITDTQAIQDALGRVESNGRPIRALVNCAGIGTVGKTLQKGEPLDLVLFQKTVEINLIGTFNVSRLVASLIAKNQPDEEGQRGVIVHTASIAAYDGQMGQTAYAASKGGIASLTLPMARDLAQYGIRVMTIAPGIFDTPLFAKLPEPARVALGQTVPFPSRLGRPAEFAMLVRQIFENPMLNGEVIRLDGALRMASK